MESHDSAAAAVKVASAIVAPLACGLAVLGGIGSFATVRHLAVPWFGEQAWIIPVGIDIGILALLAWDLLDEHLGLPWPPLRWTAWAFIAATVYLNGGAAQGNPAATVMHVAMPVLFVTIIEGVRHLIRHTVGLSAGTRLERIPAARCLLAPRSSFLLFRHMVLWHITSYQHGLALERQRLQAIAHLQQDYGHYLWRWRAPLKERLALRTALALIAELETPDKDASSPAPTSLLTDREQKLIATAAEMIQDARTAGTALSQTALARQLRERGHRIANDRLPWLYSTAITQCSGPPAEARAGGP